VFKRFKAACSDNVTSIHKKTGKKKTETKTKTEIKPGAYFVKWATTSLGIGLEAETEH
jgi:methionine-rich copper-binding protein CopC